MSRNLIVIVDASTNLKEFRRKAIRSVVGALLGRLSAPQQFALVAFNGNLEGYKMGNLCSPIESDRALSWFDQIQSQNQADLACLLGRLTYTDAPSDAVLLACGAVGQESELLSIARTTPALLRLFGVSVDCENDSLKPLCEAVRGKAMICFSSDWETTLERLERELAPQSPGDPLAEFKAALERSLGRGSSPELLHAFDAAAADVARYIRGDLQRDQSLLAQRWVESMLSLRPTPGLSKVAPERVAKVLLNIKRDLNERITASAWSNDSVVLLVPQSEGWQVTFVLEWDESRLTLIGSLPTAMPSEGQVEVRSGSQVGSTFTAGPQDVPVTTWHLWLEVAPSGMVAGRLKGLLGSLGKGCRGSFNNIPLVIYGERGQVERVPQISPTRRPTIMAQVDWVD